MSPAPHLSHLRRMGVLTALGVLCLLAMLSLTQCKYGPDKVAGLDRNKNRSATPCFQECARQYADSLKAENKLHKKNLKQCGGGGGDDDDDDDDEDDSNYDVNAALQGGGDPACIEAENARHKAALDRIKAGLKQCIESCHHQGGGTGR